MASSKVTLKLLIDTKAKKVLFAEASKDFVDFLFTLISLPIGTVIRLLSKDSMIGSLGKLYESIENLSDTYIQPNIGKDSLLNPKAPLGAAETPLLLTYELTCDAQTSAAKKFYRCRSGNYHWNVTDDPRAICPQCNYTMTTEMPYVAPPATVASSAVGEAGGYVKGVVTYMVMDDLEVKPMSTISSIAMLNSFNVKEIGALEEKVVTLDMTEGLKLLKASLETKMVLTRVFMEADASSSANVFVENDELKVAKIEII